MQNYKINYNNWKKNEENNTELEFFVLDETKLYGEQYLEQFRKEK